MSPVHDGYGKTDLLSATHRIAMLRLALESSDWLKLSDWEAKQETWTRTRLTLEYHQVKSGLLLRMSIFAFSLTFYAPH